MPRTIRLYAPIVSTPSSLVSLSREWINPRILQWIVFRRPTRFPRCRWISRTPSCTLRSSPASQLSPWTTIPPMATMCRYTCPRDSTGASTPSSRTATGARTAWEAQWTTEQAPLPPPPPSCPPPPLPPSSPTVLRSAVEGPTTPTLPTMADRYRCPSIVKTPWSRTRCPSKCLWTDLERRWQSVVLKRCRAACSLSLDRPRCLLFRACDL